MNSLKHGLSAKKLLSPLQDPAVIQQIRHGLGKDWRSLGTAGELLLDRLAREFARQDLLDLIEEAHEHRLQAAAVSQIYSHKPENVQATMLKMQIECYESEVKSLGKIIDEVKAGTVEIEALAQRLARPSVGDLFEGIDLSDREELLGKLCFAQQRLFFLIHSLSKAELPVMVHAYAALATTDLQRHREDSMRRIKQIIRQLMSLQEWRQKQEELKKKAAQSAEEEDEDGPE